VPDDLTQIANLAVKALLDTGDADLGPAGNASVGGDYSYALAPKGRAILDLICDENAAGLTPYRRLD